MSLKFNSGMDPQSEDIYSNHKNIGMLQWHEGHFRVVFRTGGDPSISLPLAVLRGISKEADRIKELLSIESSPTPTQDK